MLSDKYIVNGKLQGRYGFTTCRKSKGLEADAIVITDIDKRVLTTDAAKVFSVRASRARLYLSLLCQLSEDGCVETLVVNQRQKT